MRKEIESLLNRDISSNRIATNTVVSQAVISKLRNGKRSISGLTIETGEKLVKYERKLQKTDELNNKKVELWEPHNAQVVECLGEYFIDIENDGSNRYNVDFVSLDKVEHDNGNTYFEIGVHRTEEVDFVDDPSQDIEGLEEAWLQKDQKGETYIESIFFESEQDAIDYITIVLEGHRTFKDAAIATGVLALED